MREDNKLSNISENIFFMESVSSKIDSLSKLLKMPRPEVQKDMQMIIDRYKRNKRGKNPIEMNAQEFLATVKYFKSEDDALKFVPPKDAPIVAQNDKAIVWAVNSHAFCQSLQKYGVTWCTATPNPQYLKEYLTYNNFYVLQSKENPKELYNLATNKANDEFQEGENRSVDALNNDVDPEVILRKFGINPMVVLNWNYETPEFVTKDLESVRGAPAGTYGADGIISALRSGAPISSPMRKIIRSFVSHKNPSEAKRSAETLARFLIKEKKTSYAPLAQDLIRYDSFLLSPESVDGIVRLFSSASPEIVDSLKILAWFGSIPPKYRDKQYETRPYVMVEDLTFMFSSDAIFEYTNNPVPYLDDARAEEILEWMKHARLDYSTYGEALGKLSKPFRKAYYGSVYNNNPDNIKDLIKNYVMAFPGGPTEGKIAPEEEEKIQAACIAYLKESNKNPMLTGENEVFLAGLLGRYALGSDARNQLTARIKGITTQEMQAAITAVMYGDSPKAMLSDFLEANPFGLPQYGELLRKKMQNFADLPYERTNWYYTMSLKSLIEHWDIFVGYMTPELVYTFLNHEVPQDFSEFQIDAEVKEKNCKRIWLYLKRYLPKAVEKNNVPFDSSLFAIGQQARIPLE